MFKDVGDIIGYVDVLFYLFTCPLSCFMEKTRSRYAALRCYMLYFKHLDISAKRVSAWLN